MAKRVSNPKAHPKHVFLSMRRVQITDLAMHFEHSLNKTHAK